jgi:ABC-type spermidine/putrescine transport system permease subunit I
LATVTQPTGHKAKRGSSREQRWIWGALAAPGIIWLILLFIIPFYVVIAIAAGRLDIFENTVAVWNPLDWSGANFADVFHQLVGAGAFIGPLFVRTVAYVVIASVLSLAIAYPTAYFVTRHSGRRKVFFLVLLLAPFWVSYMMRMLAWIELLQTNGYVNKTLTTLHLVTQPVNWLSGKSSTVILGLVYGYIPYLILVLYAGLDRIDQRLLEAGRDLGLNRWRTFVRVTLPMSRQYILTGALITALPMMGDYYTNQLLSATPKTAMLGNMIDGELSNPGLLGSGAALSLLLLAVLLVPMAYYVVQTARASAYHEGAA